MPFWLFIAIFMIACGGAAVGLAWVNFRVSRYFVRRKALKLFPDDQAAEQRRAWTDLRLLEGGPLVAPFFSSRYLRRVRRQERA